MTINRLIALGGRGVKSPAERFIETKGQMERGRLRQVQEQGAYQNIGLKGQQAQQQEQERQMIMMGRLAKGVLDSENKPEAYKQARAQLPSFGVDTTKIPPEYAPEYDAGLMQMVEMAGMELDKTDTPVKRTMPAGVNEKGQNMVVDRLYEGNQVTEESEPYVKKEITREATVEAKDYGGFAGKPIGDTERRNMSKEFEIANMLDKLEADYTDDYSGFFSTNLADLAVAAGRRGIKYEDMAGYMTEYQEWKNLVRNSLFGSQLTKPEMREFERQTINPAYKASHNRKILKRQKELLARGKKRAIVALKAKGWTDEMIGEFEGSYGEDDIQKVPVDTPVSTEPLTPGTTIEMPDDEYQQRLNQILNP